MSVEGSNTVGCTVLSVSLDLLFHYIAMLLTKNTTDIIRLKVLKFTEKRGWKYYNWPW